MPNSSLQTQRFELKYIVPDELAIRVRDFVRSHMDLDSFGATQPDLSYPVHSLYLDSSDLALHQSTINGDKNRYKLRIRFYENRPGAPVYFEIKRREDNAIMKERCGVKRSGVRDILAGRMPTREDLAEVTAEDEQALLHFCDHLNKLRAKPIAHVAYRREAWVCDTGNRLRVTMDREVRSCPESTVRLEPDMDNPVLVFGNNTVLELKFTNRFPTWMRELVRIFGLRQCSAAKYVDGIVRMEEQNIIQARAHTVREAYQRDRRILRQARIAPDAFQTHLAAISR